ncbi:MAG: DUF2059 domain-containing protein [Deltaproteobacteria bacterium]
MKTANSTSLLGTLIPILVVFFAMSPAHADEPDHLIDRALALSGVTEQLNMLGGAILGAIPVDAFPDSRTRRRMGSLLHQTAGKEKLVPLIRQSIKENFSREKIEQVIDFYDSKLGRKVGRIASVALEPRVLKGVREGRNIVNRLSESRLLILSRLARAEKAAQSNCWLRSPTCSARSKMMNWRR